jgi:hypothetical protein
MDAMQLELSNFQPLAPNEEEAPDLGGAEQPLPPVIETSNHDLASLIRSVGMTSITDIERLVGELQKTRDYLQAEGERVQAETVQYIALTGAASASVKIIFDALRAWRTADPSDHNQSQASAFEITDAEIEDASDCSHGPSRTFG